MKTYASVIIAAINFVNMLMVRTMKTNNAHRMNATAMDLKY